MYNLSFKVLTAFLNMVKWGQNHSSPPMGEMPTKPYAAFMRAGPVRGAGLKVKDAFPF